MYHLSLLQTKICVSSCLPSRILIYSSWKSDSAPTSLTQPLYLADRLFVNPKPLVFLSPSSALFLQSFLSGRRPLFNSWVRKLPWRRDRLSTPVFLGFLCGSAAKESTCSAGDLGSIPGLGRSSGEGKGYPLQDSGLENSMDCIVYGVAESDTTELTFTFTNCIFYQIYV